jgi:hypothetical protein
MLGREMLWVHNAMLTMRMIVFDVHRDEWERLRKQRLWRVLATCAGYLLLVNLQGLVTDWIGGCLESCESQKTKKSVDCDHVVYLTELY